MCSSDLCRTVAIAIQNSLPNEVQVAVSREVLGESWHANRDFYGWVDVESGALIGTPVTCPPADLLMLVPTKLDRRDRKIDLGKAARMIPRTAAPTEFAGLAESCQQTTKAFEDQQANPLVAILRPIAKQFRGAALVVSPFTWKAGILFKRGSSALADAQDWIRSHPLPRYLEPLTLSTASTRLVANEDA